MRLKSFFVAIHADVSDLCGGEQDVNAVYHAQSCAQNGNNRNAVVGDHLLFGFLERSFDFHGYRFDVFKAFVGHKCGYFFNQLAKLLHSGFFVAKNGNFVLDKRMVEDNYVVVLFHIIPPWGSLPGLFVKFFANPIGVAT